MDALTLLREQAANADNLLLQTFESVTPDQAGWRLPGSAANTIGATFFHCYASVDEITGQLLARPRLFETGGWSERLGYDAQTVWGFEGKQDPGLLLAFAREVSAAASVYLAGLTPGALDREIETRRGPRPLGGRLSVYLVIHQFQHLGEIAALLGCQGVKGLPF
ncbi:MAG: DinB family protein [Dehalococcoidia bacterium]|nr:DinB family protein [Dehalococcoidia bacterium]